MIDTKRPLKVFLCHAHADRDSVRGLYTRLTQDGVDAWLDKAKLLPGQDWELEIRKAVREADVVVVCLSKQFNQAGFRQKEVRLALDTAMEKPEGEIFIIPARLEECDNLESLRKWHWVDLFEDDGYDMLTRALRARANSIGVTLQIKKGWLPSITAPRKSEAPVEKKPERKPPAPKADKPKPEMVESVKVKTTRKTNTAIIVALIGLVGTIITAIIGSPLVENWLSPSLVSIGDGTVTVTSQPVISSKTIEPNETPATTFTPTTSPSPVPSAKGSGKIAFVAVIDGNEDIYVMNSDGSDRTRLTQNPGKDYFPIWSPDGTQIAFFSEREEGKGIYIMDFDGSEQKPLATIPSDLQWYSYGSFSWSPDSKKIVFESFDESRDLSIISLDTLSQVKLTTSSPDETEFKPVWSPDGSKIAFSRQHIYEKTAGVISWDPPVVFVINTDGSNEIKVFEEDDRQKSIYGISWHPDSSKILFGIARGYPESNADVLVVELGSLNSRKITAFNNGDYNPVWSPDGSKIAFVARVEGVYEIFLANPDGTNLHQLSELRDIRGEISNLHWSADGKRLVFTYYKSPYYASSQDIYIIDVGSGEFVNLSANEQYDNYQSTLSP